ncbi:MAG: hypothetical protein HYS57_01870 [Parcubacteria group bacterium]|nr:hypothetical protein [Parcubacteria group bacterium]
MSLEPQRGPFDKTQDKPFDDAQAFGSEKPQAFGSEAAQARGTRGDKSFDAAQDVKPFDAPLNSRGVRLSRRHFVKYAIVLVAIFVVAFGALVLSGGRSPVATLQEYWSTRKIMREVREREEFEKNDTYGGKTPEETYQLFLQALEKQDIELASKYFVREKQGEIQQRLTKIKDNGKWQFMYEDLSGKKTKQSFKSVHESWHEVEILNDSGGLIAAFRIEKYGVKDLWKLTQFF